VEVGECKSDILNGGSGDNVFRADCTELMLTRKVMMDDDDDDDPL
jgi:hypothetical protein